MEYLPQVVSVIALCVSIFTAWFTIFRRGTVQSTRPSFVALRYDFVGKAQPQAKIFLRTMLYSTGKRGLVIESLLLRVREGRRDEEFSFWGYGDKDLVRGSGLFVGENGVVVNHHFNPIRSEKLFAFTAGIYKLELVARIVGRDELVTLSVITLDVPNGGFDSVISPDTAVYFNWSPLEERYVESIENRNAGRNKI